MTTKLSLFNFKINSFEITTLDFGDTRININDEQEIRGVCFDVYIGDNNTIILSAENQNHEYCTDYEYSIKITIQFMEPKPALMFVQKCCDNQNVFSITQHLIEVNKRIAETTIVESNTGNEIISAITGIAEIRYDGEDAN